MVTFVTMSDGVEVIPPLRVCPALPLPAAVDELEELPEPELFELPAPGAVAEPAELLVEPLDPVDPVEPERDPIAPARPVMSADTVPVTRT